MTKFENDRLIEKIETLDGSRGGGRDTRRQAAVRVADLAPLLELPPKLKSTKAAGSAPTQAEFDALRDDLEAMYLRLTAIREILQTRLLG